MKFAILQENLVAAANIVRRAIPNKPQLPILATLLISAQDGRIELRATDLYLGIKSFARGTVEKPGQAAVPARIFFDVLSNLNPGKIEVMFENDQLSLSSQGSSSQIQCLSAEDFPIFPQLEDEVPKINIKNFTQKISKVLFAASRDESRPALTCVLFDLNQQSQLVATNGFRLAVCDLEQEFTGSKLLIPAKSLTEIAAIMKQLDIDDVKMGVADQLKQIFIYLGEHEVSLRLMEGDFPPFEKIIPTTFATEVRMEAGEFLQHLKAAQIFARDLSNIVSLKIEADKLNISSASAEFGKHQGQMAAKTSGQLPAEVAFNINYLLDFLNILKPKTLWFGMNESLQPTMFKDDEAADFAYVVMPFKLNQ